MNQSSQPGVTKAGRDPAWLGRGQSTVEYALVIALLAIVVVAALSLLGQSLYTTFYGITEAIQLRCGQAGVETFLSYAGEGAQFPPESLSIPRPATGKVTQDYWFCHKGWDIASNEGSPIRTVASGTIKFAGWSDQGYGNLVVIDHGSYQTLYAHLRQEPSLSVGQAVAGGQVIGGMGDTGFSTGPHLHFEIRLGSELVDPGPLFE
jgi:murein DD-endopeptidase MepM/ murein hydrolase activator NlpD